MRAIKVWETSLGPEHINLGKPLFNLGLLEGKHEHHVAARAAFERVLSIREKASGPDTLTIAPTLGYIAEAYLAEGNAAAALAPCERALSLFATADPPHPGEPSVRFVLARILVALDKDRERAISEATKAADAYRERGAPAAEDLQDVEDWLRTHGGG